MYFQFISLLNSKSNLELEYDNFKRSAIEALCEKEEAILLLKNKLEDVEAKFQNDRLLLQNEKNEMGEKLSERSRKLEQKEAEMKLKQKEFEYRTEIQIKAYFQENEEQNKKIQTNLMEELAKSDEAKAAFELELNELKTKLQNTEEKYRKQIDFYLNEIDELEKEKCGTIRIEELEKIELKHQKQIDSLLKTIEETKNNRNNEIMMIKSENIEILRSVESKEQDNKKIVEIKESLKERVDSLEKNLLMKEDEIQELREEYEDKIEEMREIWYNEKKALEMKVINKSEGEVEYKKKEKDR